MPAWALGNSQSAPQPQRSETRAAVLRRLLRVRPNHGPLRGFVSVSLCTLIIGMLVISWWLSSQIEANVIQRTTETNALYIESFVAPLLQDTTPTELLTPAQAKDIDSILVNTPLGRELVAFVIWAPDGRVRYSSDASQVGKVYPLEDTIVRSWAGEVTWELDRQGDEEHVPDQHRANVLLATYAPVRNPATGQIVAVAEFYQTADLLMGDIQAAQQGTWLIVGLVTLAMFLVFVLFIRAAEQTIVRQQSELGNQVAQLTQLLGQNAELHERVQRASRRGAMLHERFLRRVSAELHDGPAQYLSLALLHMDRIETAKAVAAAEAPAPSEHMVVAQTSVSQALQEVRAISSGLALPQIERLALPDLIARAVRTHERRTHTAVDLSCTAVPAEIPADSKLTLYRVLQESLNNAYRHAGGKGQEVRVWVEDASLVAVVSDGGPGLLPCEDEREEHLGLAGMRERVESIGGTFAIESAPGVGTRIRAQIPLYERSEDGF